ncbi:MAG: bifunctional 2-C-methyl-D-erythritol 4-phosphate cytidylyltransferase/2-C-methyl-D-erythritol 2,4-cyclodiphosphate synthase [Rhodobacteraceae bacterium]|nr:bifunctional 2-C-methyl-D-erythritol 4-phosphate cytidylyltransferase/2-C-methyl-D-erythritol 2,4-cyclodiphosphate synthase [Alphaproteobacteria bacterium]NNF71195.1 bifunctional 2-C-methyl-D-erythritol 4-phosphate cytidylyltransferase/2-C-methyl-D-erythritol 2,4-cyclodiphosphate synthase [Paracoccaceae bacterium]NNK66643.1 bifunctional 2-C-methyl-D-erythritol 4-phosphate cytidylyltransferase/2-C-methyl-D-erythritol 2,4-cyclodiphosphate synthase [Paracoccaceae bacterium]
MSDPARTAAIIVAAGRGTRAGEGLPKQWRTLAGRRVIDWTIAAFEASPHVGQIVVVLHADDLDRLAPREGLSVVTGGATRAASVRAGLETLADTDTQLVLIHDAARACVPDITITDMTRMLEKYVAVAPGLPVTDALWKGGEEKPAFHMVIGTQDRTGLYRAQTPQAFRFPEILAAHRAYAGDAADDVEVARAAGIDVRIGPGHEDNIKITTARDFTRAERILKDRMTTSIPDIRTGNGFDVHRFGPGDHVTLCGIDIPHGRGLQGHSDADVGLHTVTDAIYGALAAGDIGRHFPPTDPQWKGAASRIFLEHAVGLARDQGFMITHIDCTLICEAPKIGPHAPGMTAKMAEITGLDPTRISIKATTSERLGFTGREEGIAALATVTLVRA